MVYRGTVRNGKIEIEGDDCGLPDGAVVRVELIDDPSETDQNTDSLFDIGRQAVPIGQSDLATNLDHYLYGHPKVSDERG